MVGRPQCTAAAGGLEAREEVGPPAVCSAEQHREGSEPEAVRAQLGDVNELSAAADGFLEARHHHQTAPPRRHLPERLLEIPLLRKPERAPARPRRR
jgi:hypothetical protein